MTGVEALPQDIHSMMPPTINTIQDSSSNGGGDYIDFDINFDTISEDFQGSTLLELLTGANLLEISRDIKKGWSEVKEHVSC